MEKSGKSWSNITVAGRGQISLQQWDLLWSPSKGPVSGGGGGGGVHNMLITEGQVLNQGFKDGSYRSTVGGLLISHLQSRGLTARSWEIQNLYVTAAVRGSRLLMMAQGRINRGTGGHQMSHKLIFSHPLHRRLICGTYRLVSFHAERFEGAEGASRGRWSVSIEPPSDTSDHSPRHPHSHTEIWA